MCGQEIFSCCFFTNKRIAVDDTYTVVSRLKIVCQHIRKLSTNFGLHILRGCNLTTSNSYGASEINLACTQQTPQNNHNFRSKRPNYFAFIDRSYFVNLYAYVSSWIQALETSHFYVFSFNWQKFRI